MSTQKNKCEICLEFNDPKILNAIEQALLPEKQANPSDRTILEINRNEKALNLRFRAQDLTSLRAAVNSYMRWIISIQDVLNSIIKESVNGA